MSTLPGLPNLPDLSGNETAQKVASKVSDTASAVASSLNPTAKFLGGSIANFVLIILGLLFIAAGIFSFDKTREVITKAGKAAAAAA
jgi:hypothetical protein